MSIESVKGCLTSIIYELQALVKYQVNYDGSFTYMMRNVRKPIVVETPKLVVDYQNDNDFVKIYNILDGLVDLLYYIHFCLSKYIAPEDRTDYMNMVREFVEAAGIVDTVKVKHSFMWKMFLSEMFEIMIAYTDDWEATIGNCIVMRDDNVDVRIQLHIVEDKIIECAGELGIPKDKFYEAFKIVHSANMAKRWEDGTYHKDSIGKIIKPPGWKEGYIDQICYDLMS